MKVVITGGTGFVGVHLCRHWLNQGHTVTAIGSREQFQQISDPRFHYLSADTTEPGVWQQSVANAELTINLTGRTIFRRWTTKYKEQIYRSRIRTTQHLVDALSSSNKAILISTSAVGYYGDGGDAWLTETNSNGQGFLASLAAEWEAAAQKAVAKGVRVVLARFSIILGADGGALARMLPVFRIGLGGRLGSGRQWLSWMHIHDLNTAMDFIVKNNEIQGPVNFCAPNPIPQRQYAQALGKALRRWTLLPLPAFMLKLLMGELAAVVLESQRAVPQKLLDAGFCFRYPKIEDALADLVRNKAGHNV